MMGDDALCSFLRFIRFDGFFLSMPFNRSHSDFFRGGFGYTTGEMGLKSDLF